MTDTRERMHDAIDDQIKQLAKLRDVRYVDAAVSVASTFAANLADSRGSSYEAYWAAMVSVADGIAAEQTGVR